MSSVAEYYDDLSAHYHLLFADWEETIRSQAAIVQRLLEPLGPGPKRLLDAACGIGTQALGLAALGHQVTGSDLSPGAVQRAKREAAARGLKARFGVADLRALSGYHAGPFDAVCTLDNALPHLETDEELATALREVASLLAPGGLFLASLRDYDRLAAEQPRVTPPRVLPEPGGHRVVFQIWDWRHDRRGYRLHQYILRHRLESEPRTLVFATDYWILRRERLARLAEGAGLTEARWHETEATKFYQPIFTARRRP